MQKSEEAVASSVSMVVTPLDYRKQQAKSTTRSYHTNGHQSARRGSDSLVFFTTAHLRPIMMSLLVVN